MTRQCAWCGRALGPCPPFDDRGVSHGMCRPCGAAVFPGADTGPFPEPLAGPAETLLKHPAARGLSGPVRSAGLIGTA